VRGFLAVALVLAAGCAEQAERPQAPPLPEVRLDQFKGPVLAEAQSLLARLHTTPEDPQLNGRLAMLLDAYQQLDGARVMYQRARAFEPGALGWRYLSGVAEAASGDYETAVASFHSALEVDPSFAPAKRRLAEALIETGDLDAARTHLADVLQARPQDARALVALGRLAAREDQSEQAAATLRQAVDAAPGYGAAHYELALALRDLGQTDESARQLALYEENPRREPPSDDPLRAQVQAMRVDPVSRIARAADLEQAGRLEEAVQQLQLALADDPDLGQAHVNLMILFGKAGRPDLADQHYRSAIRLGEDGAELHYNYGVVKFITEKYAEAEQSFRRALEANPRHAGSLHNLGQMLEAKGRLGDAEKHYRRALEARPGYRLADFHLGRVLLARGRAREAVTHIERTVGPRDEQSVEFLATLAEAYARLGDQARAQSTADRARALARELGLAGTG